MPRLLTSAQWPHLLTLWGMLLWLTVGGYNRMEASATGSAPNDSRCPLGAAVETQGYRRLALIVGVGDYKNPDIRRLQGAPHDAQRFYALLTGPHGYDFPKENVCVLLDAAATTARFRQAFDQALVARARAKDVVVVYFAGHGSRTKDTSGDEPDGWDETLVLHDARTGGVGDLVDDELQDMLTQLYAKTQDITVILDSCHSGTATREETDTAVARYVPPAALPATSPANSAASGGRAAGWVYAAMPGLVVFTAASDGTSAWERDGRGVFTDALLQVLAPSTTPPLTYAQAARQIAPLVAARRYQIPYFQGELTRPVFSNAGRLRPVAWEVIAIGPPIRLGGPPLPGLGPGAEMRIYDGTVTGAETRDPGKAKATVILDATTELNATGHTATPRSDAPPIGVGDVAVLARPAESLRRIKLRVRPVPEPGGIPEARAAAVRSAIATHHEARMLVELAPEADDFELLMDADGRLQLNGPEKRRRNTYTQDADIPTNLWQHARQRALLLLRGEGGTEFRDQHTLQVQLVPASPQTLCAQGVWTQAAPNEEQIVPLCHQWHVKVQVRRETPTPLLVGGVVLSTDGSLLGFPADGRFVRLRPGESGRFNALQETFVGKPPLEVRDHVLVFGTKETNPVPWHLLTQRASERARGGVQSTLYRALDHYLQPGTRGLSPPEDTTWTVSSVPMRVRDHCALAHSHDACGRPSPTNIPNETREPVPASSPTGGTLR